MKQSKRKAAALLSAFMLTAAIPEFYTIPRSENIVFAADLLNMAWSVGGDCLTVFDTAAIPDYETADDAPWANDASKIKSLVIQDGVQKIGANAFGSLKNLEKIIIADSVCEIGLRAFDGTKWFDEQMDGVVYVGRNAYTYKGEMPASANILLNDGTVSVADGAFRGQSNAVFVLLPNTLERIGVSAFEGCSSLNAIDFPPSIRSIGANAFFDCAALHDVWLLDSITEIGENAFGMMHAADDRTEIVDVDDFMLHSEANSAAEVYAEQHRIGGNMINYVEYPYFYNPAGNGNMEMNHCALYAETIVIPEKIGYYPITEISRDCFVKNSFVKELVIPAALRTFDSMTAFWLQGLEKYTVSEESAYFRSIDGMLYDKAGETLFSSPMGKAKTELIVPNGTKTICESAFLNHADLETVVLPDLLERIDTLAFCLCPKLQNVQFGEHIQSISAGAFYRCDKIGETKNGVRYINNWAFECDKEATKIVLREGTVGIADDFTLQNPAVSEIVLPKSLRHIGERSLAMTAATTLTIPESVESVGEYAFAGNENLAEIYLPADISMIPENAFYGCTNLTDLYIGGKKTDWMPDTDAHTTTNLYHFSGGSGSLNGCIIGDFNDDNQVTIADAVALSRWIMGEEVPCRQWLAGDLNSDGTVNAVDLVLLKQKLIGKSQEHEHMQFVVIQS